MTCTKGQQREEKEEGEEGDKHLHVDKKTLTTWPWVMVAVGGSAAMCSGVRPDRFGIINADKTKVCPKHRKNSSNNSNSGSNRRGGGG